MASSTYQSLKISTQVFHESLAYFNRPIEIFKGYRREYLKPDILAGLTVAVVLLPQSIAYALIAELPPQVGVYAAIVAAIVGALWGSSDHLHTGPTNPASLLVLSTLITVVPPGTPAYVAAAGLLAVMVGAAKLLMGLARLGVLVNFVSDSVILGFTAGAGVLISITQLHLLFGIDVPSSSAVYETFYNTIATFPATNTYSLIIGMLTLLIIVLVMRFRPKWPNALIGMILASILVAVFDLESQGVRVLGELPRTLPPLARLPLTDIKLIGEISVGALAISAIGLVEAISITRSISAQSGQRLDSNQEFVGQGLANIAAGFLSGYTCSGSFTRSAMNYNNGAKTAMSSVFSGIWVLLALLLFAPLAAYIPTSALAAVIIITSFKMINWREMDRIRKSSLGDTAIMIATLLATLFLPIQFAVLAGMIVSFARYLIKTSMPEVYPVIPNENFQHFVRADVQEPCLQLGVINIGGSLYFGATHHVEDVIHLNLEQHPEQKYLLLRMNMVDHCDISGIHMLESIARLYWRRGGDIFLIVRDSVKESMQVNGFVDFIGEENYLIQEYAIGHIFHNILDPSVCLHECHLRVFAECQALHKNIIAEHIPDGEQLPEYEIIHRLPSEVKQMIEANDNGKSILIIDVREQPEFDGGHISDAELLPLRYIKERGRILPLDHHIIFVCRSGRRSTLAAYIMKDMGYEDVCNMQGGMLAWVAAGYPVAVE